jgi:hypothetical protein
MYVDSSSSTIKGKTYRRHLLRESFREDGRVKHRTIASLSACSSEEIEAIRLALRYKGRLQTLLHERPDVSFRQGAPVGAVWTLFDLARQMGIAEALGDSRQGRLALWQVIARALDQGSRLSAVRLAQVHPACDVLGLDGFNEEDLYDNLDWLCKNQPGIEDRLWRSRARANEAPRAQANETSRARSNEAPRARSNEASRAPVGELFLYDVTSSYFEGTQNELAAFGYNRDGKRGKRQIVIGLLCDAEGEPVSIEVFTGNTSDPKTFSSQVRKVSERFGGGAVTFVGDRGMIKSAGIEELTAAGFHYITALTKPQIQTLLSRGAIQLELFDEHLAEVCERDGGRYVLRRNPARAAETAASREGKLASLRKRVGEHNDYLRDRLRAHVATALRLARERSAKLRIDGWATIEADETGRRLNVVVDEAARNDAAQLDGCYVLTTDLAPAQADKETVHGRYKDLALVERAFRTSKTVELQMRPIFVRREERTRGHALVVMLAYRLIRELTARWSGLDLLVHEGLNELAGLCAMEIFENGHARCQSIPAPRDTVARLLEAARVRLPEALPCRGAKVSTKRKLTERRKQR